jgi:hypothetical protein
VTKTAWLALEPELFEGGKQLDDSRIRVLPSPATFPILMAMSYSGENGLLTFQFEYPDTEVASEVTFAEARIRHGRWSGRVQSIRLQTLELKRSEIIFKCEKALASYQRVSASSVEKRSHVELNTMVIGKLIRQNFEQLLQQLSKLQDG